MVGKGFDPAVVESVNVHDDIKIGLPSRDKYIEMTITLMLWKFKKLIMKLVLKDISDLTTVVTFGVKRRTVDLVMVYTTEH